MGDTRKKQNNDNIKVRDKDIHESKVLRITYREIIRWIAFIIVFGLSILAFLKSDSASRSISSNPDYKREILFGVVLAFIELLLLNVTFFMLAYATPGVFKSLLKKKNKRMSHVSDPGKAERFLGNLICLIYAFLFMDVLLIAGIEGRYAGMNFLSLWCRFIIIMLPLALWNAFYLSDFLFVKTKFYNNWVTLASGVVPEGEYTEPQWTNRKRKNFLLTPIDSLLIALIFWLVI